MRVSLVLGRANSIADQILVFLERVINNRANAGPFTDGRHSAAQRPLACHRIRELTARRWSGVIDHAEIPIKEDTTTFDLPQDSSPVIRVRDRVFPYHLLRAGCQVSGDRFNVLARDVDPGLATTVCTLLAVDLLFDFLRDLMKEAVGVRMRLQIASDWRFSPSFAFPSRRISTRSVTTP